MRRTAAVLAITLAALAAGCATAPAGEAGGSDASPLAKVKPGMSAVQVQELVGEPTAVERQGAGQATEVWYYDGGVLILRNRAVQFSYPLPASPI